MMSISALPNLRFLLATLLLTLAACGSPDHANPIQYADDAGITARVRMALIQDPRWRDANLQVSTQSGVVRLTGTLPEDQSEEELLAVVQAVDGVRDVRNDVR